VRKIFVAVVLIVAFAVPAAALSATLKTQQQRVYSCEFGGSFHFIQNQTGTTAPTNILQATFTGGMVVQNKDNVTPGGVYHWTIDAPPGTLVTATSTIADGNLVLSDFTCNVKKGGKK
jgi:hypothetical protein